MDTSKSSIKGKAYEYACVLALIELVAKRCSVNIIDNTSLRIAKSRYENDILPEEKVSMLLSAKAGVVEIMKMEPRIIAPDVSPISISIQPDSIATKNGDIRDVLIIRSQIGWEIGISVKHNHSALKHSRLSSHLDFGKVWLDTPCSSNYFQEISPIFDKLKSLHRDRLKWRSLADKEDSIYLPLLNAFRDELERINSVNPKTTEKLVRYLVGSNGKDYYKLIHNQNHTITVIPFNLYGTLNQSFNNVKPDKIIPSIELPTRIIEIAYKPNSKNTLILVMDNYWAISFRIHNASTVVEPSLKFDIQLAGQPAGLFYINQAW